jgi:hypothetical protein
MASLMHAQGVIEYNTPGTFTFEVPMGVTSITVEATGAGGGGSRSTSASQGRGGGGGGAYARTENITVTPGQSFTVVVGGGGSGNPGNNGGDSQFSEGATIIALAQGGRGPGQENSSGAAGGEAASSIGDVTRSGGAGGNRGACGGTDASRRSGAGGGAAGTNNNGSTPSTCNGQQQLGGAGGTVGGGKGGDGTTDRGQDGRVGDFPGGGGSGGSATGLGGDRDGGRGGHGQVKITLNRPIGVFGDTGANQTYNVPAGVCQVAVYVWGAGGAGGDNSRGGGGAFVSGFLDVTPGQILNIAVGRGGIYEPNTTRAWSNGGATAGPNTSGAKNGGGGGLTGIFSNATYSSANALVIAGSGGGGGRSGIGHGGAGGIANGSDGADEESCTGGRGGTQAAGGAGGQPSSGSGGACGDPMAGANGGVLIGGNGGSRPTYITCVNSAGGGGGAGYFGGGGGATFQSSGWCSGGGGGSSFTGNLTNLNTAAGSGQTQGCANCLPFNLNQFGRGGNSSGAGQNGRVVIIPLVAPGLSVAVNGERCSTGSVTISVNSVPADCTIDWFANATGGSPLASGTSVFATPSISTTTTYYAQTRNTITGARSCSRVAVIATVHPLSVGGDASADQTICYNTQPATLTLTGHVGTIQWQVSPDNSAWSNISGATSTTLTGAQMGALTATRYYRAVVTSGVCAPENSNTVAITVDPLSVGGTASADQTICYNTQPANLTLTGHVGTIQWQVSPDNSAWSNISGATSTTLTGAQMGALTATRYYRAVVTSGVCAPENSNTVTITVRDIFNSGSIASTSQTICSGASPEDILYSVNPSGGSNLEYQWYRQDGVHAAPSGSFVLGSWVPVGSQSSSTTLLGTTVGALTTTATFALRVIDVGTPSCIDSWAGHSHLVNVLSASNNAYLVDNSTAVATIEQCVEGGWTYYAVPGRTDEFVFGIYKNGNVFEADVTIIDEEDYDYYESVKPGVRGTWIMGRTWNVDITSSGSIDNSMCVRFFVNIDEIEAARAAATAFVGLSGSTVTPLTFFKHPTSAFDPNSMMVEGNFTFTPQSWTFGPANPSAADILPLPSGTMNGVAYFDLCGITSFSGGSAGFSVNDGTPALLPVELLSFSARAVNNTFIQLDWSTATEVNNEGFDVERSFDGVNFEKIGFVAGNGNSTVVNHYQFNDTEVSVGIHYYRLKQVDFDGQFEYSNIVSARIDATSTFAVSPFIPNPAETSSSLVFSVKKPTAVKVVLYNGIGQLVDSRFLDLKEGSHTETFNVDKLSAGVYTAIITIDDQSFSRKLMVTK